MESSIISTQINKGIILDEYSSGIRFGTDALLLSHFCGKEKRVCDLGCGSGVLALLLLSLGKASSVTGVELMSEYASLSIHNGEKNGFSDNFDCINCDVKDIKSFVPSGVMDAVVTNPPYLKENCGMKNENILKYTAFHETTAGIDEFLMAAGYILKYGGTFYCVYRPEYIARLIFAMEKADIKLKRLRYVYPSPQKPPSLILVEGKKSGNDGTVTEKPLYIFSDSTHSSYSPEMDGIYNEFN